MIIDSSAIAMGSTHQETKIAKVESSITLNTKDGKLSAKDEKEAAKITFSERAKQMMEEQASRAKTQSTGGVFGIGDVNSRLKMQNELINKIFEMLRGLREGKGQYRGKGVLDLFLEKTSNMNSMQSMPSGGNRPIQLSPGNGVWERTVKVSSFAAEAEVTTFSSVGNVRTADGRTISFNVEFEMSRSFMQATDFIQKDTVQIMTDPLVINLDANVASVSDQKFLFDLDADGIKDEISYLNRGSGFLALDKNNDGVINDGNELFGTKSGDGFADLMQYDGDKNGWIDENDEIFQHLKVWIKDANGNDRLLSLKEANVGAIFLGSVSTQFSLNNMETNEANAAIRKTGVFLRETGEVGTIQHVDFAI